MKRRTRLALVVALLFALMAPTAQAARRSSLGGNLLITDVKDIFFFPHQVARYVNFVWFDMLTGVSTPVGVGPGAGDPMLGSGGILFGNAATESFGIGITTHRSDYQNATSAIVRQSVMAGFMSLGNFYQLLENSGVEDNAAIYDDITGLDSLQWLDLLAGFKITNEIDLGLRLSFGSNLLTQAARDGADEGDNNPGESFNSYNFLLSGGYAKGDESIVADIALEFNITSAKYEDLNVTNSGSGFGFALAGRAFFALSEAIDLGVILGLETRSRSTEFDEGAGVDTSNSDLAFSVGVGPRYTIGEEATIAAYATIGVFQSTLDPDGSDNLQDGIAWLLPGINIAAEWWITNWFAYRAGLVSQYALLSAQQQDPSPSGGTESKARSLFFYWTNGIGFSALDNDLNFDAMINWPIITNGPNFLGGNAGGLFAMVTASYSF